MTMDNNMNKNNTSECIKYKLCTTETIITTKGKMNKQSKEKNMLFNCIVKELNWNE